MNAASLNDIIDLTKKNNKKIWWTIVTSSTYTNNNIFLDEVFVTLSMEHFKSTFEVYFIVFLLPCIALIEKSIVLPWKENVITHSEAKQSNKEIKEAAVRKL